jgi:hypothetical protein
MPHSTSIRTNARRLVPLSAAALALTAGVATAATDVQDGIYRGKTSFHSKDPANHARVDVRDRGVLGASMFITRTCRKSNGHVDHHTSGPGTTGGAFRPPLRIGATGRFNGTGRYTRQGKKARHGRVHLVFKGRFRDDGSATGVFAESYKIGPAGKRVKCKLKRVHWHVALDHR